jgi:large subunit ribosomal protein L30
MNETLTYSQFKSSIGSSNGIKAVLIGLGLTRMNKTVTKKNTPELRGMLVKVRHLVKLEE